MDRRIALVAGSGLLVADGTDGTWTTEETPLDGRGECVLLDDRRPDRVLVGTHDGGLVRYADGEATRVGAESIGPDAVTAVTAHPTDAEHLLAGTEPSAIYRSRDGGATWTAVDDLEGVPSSDEWSFPPRPHTHHVRWIEVDPTDPDRWYVGIEAGALLVTTDAGATWVDRPPGSRRDNHTIATHPDAPGRVYSAAGDGYAESTDSGETWTTLHDGLDHRYVWGLAVDRDDPDTVVVSAASGASSAHRTPGDAHLYRREGASDWDRLDDGGVPTGPGHRRAVLAAGPDAGEFAAATDDGLYRSADGGESWDRLPVELPDRFAGELPRGVAMVARP